MVPEANPAPETTQPRKAAAPEILIVVSKPAQSMTVTVDGRVRYRWRVSTGATHYSTPDGSYTPFRMELMHYSREFDNAGMPHAVEKSLKSLDEQIEKWKADKGVTGPVTVTAEKPQPHPFWRSSVPSYALLPPDVVSDSAYTICWTGVVSPVVCTSGARVCW